MDVPKVVVAGLCLTLLSCGSAKGSDGARRAASTSTTATTTTTLAYELALPEMQQEIDRSCSEAVASGHAPKVRYQSRWSAAGSEEKVTSDLLASAKACALARTTNTIAGSVYLDQDEIRKIVDDTGRVVQDNPTCEGIGGYDDIDAATGVTVRDEKDVIIATGSLAKSEWVGLHDEHIPGTDGVPAFDSGDYHMDAIPGTPGQTMSSGGCRLYFSIPNVPKHPFYSIEVGHRGAVTYSTADLEAKNWNLALVLS